MDEDNNRIIAIGDIHGRFDLLEALRGHVEGYLKVKTPWGLDAGWEVIQLGDKNDRGKDSYLVAEHFRSLKLLFPSQVHCLLGNHEEMLIDACKNPGHDRLLWWNGGHRTERSYSKVSNCYGVMRLGESVKQAGHWGFYANDHVLFMETQEYFFCHAPIPQAGFRLNMGFDQYVTWPENLTWGCRAIPWEQGSSKWVDPFPWGSEKKFIYGHVHDLRSSMETDEMKNHRIRRYGNAYLVDTGSGCALDAPLSALILPEGVGVSSTGEVYELP